MKKAVKRVSALLCAVVLACSMLVITASAAYGRFEGGSTLYTGKGTYASSWSTMFKGDGITKITISRSSSKAPNVSMSVSWSRAGYLCPVNLYFTGGNRGTYYYYLKLWNNNTLLATQTIKFTNNVW